MWASFGFSKQFYYCYYFFLVWPSCKKRKKRKRLAPRPAEIEKAETAEGPVDGSGSGGHDGSGGGGGHGGGRNRGLEHLVRPGPAKWGQMTKGQRRNSNERRHLAGTWDA